MLKNKILSTRSEQVEEAIEYLFSCKTIKWNGNFLQERSTALETHANACLNLWLNKTAPREMVLHHHKQNIKLKKINNELDNSGQPKIICQKIMMI